MSENDLLLSRIGQLAGQINRMKTQNGNPGAAAVAGAVAGAVTGAGTATQQQGYPQYPNHSSYSSHNSHNSHNSYSQYNQTYPRGAGRGSPYWIPSQQRGAPSYRGRGRGGRAAPTGHRHRSLVLNGGSNSGPNTPSGTPGASTPSEEAQQDGSLSDSQQPSGNWIAKRDRHMQLINTSVYEQQAAARAKAMEKTRQDKVKRREERDKTKLKLFLLRKNAAAGGIPAQHEVVIGGARYKIGSGGSKLLKVPEDSGTPTPKSAVVGGVKFVRSKTGNLWRAGFVKVKRYAHGRSGLFPSKVIADIKTPTTTSVCRNVKQHKISKPCKFFTQTDLTS